MDFSQVFNLFNNQNFIPIVYKFLAIFLSVFYLFYAIIISKQTQVMNNALEVEGNQIFNIVAIIQIIIALMIIFLAIFLI